MKIYTQKNTIFFVFFFFISFFGSFSLVKPADVVDYSVFSANSNISNYVNSSAYYNPSDFSGQPFPKATEEVSCLDLQHNLNIGNRDYTIFGPVTRLQTFLYQNEYMIYPPTGLFIYYTFDGVRNFQRDNGLVETGVVDKNTREALKKATCQTTKVVPITPVVTPQPIYPTYYCSLNNTYYSSQIELNSKCINSSPVDPKTVYFINYNSNNADSGSPTLSSQSVITGSSVILSDEGTMIKNGYTFDGWSTSPTGTNSISAGSTYTPNSNTTFYAVWTQDAGYTYTVEYDVNGADGGSPSTYTQTVNVGDSLILANPQSMYKNGYTFMGWSINSTTGTPLLEATDDYTPPSDITLYAVWQGGTNGGSGGGNGNTIINNPVSIVNTGDLFGSFYISASKPVTSLIIVDYTYNYCTKMNLCIPQTGQAYIYPGSDKSTTISPADMGSPFGQHVIKDSKINNAYLLFSTNNLSTVNSGDGFGSFYVSSSVPIKSTITVDVEYTACFTNILCSQKNVQTHIYIGSTISEIIDTISTMGSKRPITNPKINNAYTNQDSTYIYTY